MVIKTKISTVTAAVAAIAAIAAMGSIGGIGLGQQQMAFATDEDDGDSSGTDTSIIILPDIALATDVVDDGVDGSINNLDVTSVFTKQEEDMNPPIAEDLLANVLEDVDAVAIGGPVACCDLDCLRLVPNCEPPPRPVVVS
jgi:hypothetical protein